MKKLSKLTLVTAIALAAGLSSPAGAGEIWSIGTPDDSNDEFSLINSNGGYIFEVGVDTDPDDFPIYTWGPDEQPPGALAGDNNPLTIRYTTGCFLLPGYNAQFLLDLEVVKNDLSEGDIGDILEWKVSTGLDSTTRKFTGIDTDGVDSPDEWAIPNPDTFPVTQAQLGEDIVIEMLDGQAMGYDYLELSGPCVDAYAKVSGGIDNPDVSGPGKKAPLVTFEGAIGIESGSGDIIGSISVNYKNWNGLENVVCEFTPGDTTELLFNDAAGADGRANIKNLENSCADGALDRIVIIDKNAVSSVGAPHYCTNDGRGCFGVVGDSGADYRVADIAYGYYDTHNATLNRGNGIVDEDTSD